MAEKVLMLALSPTMEEGTINRWHKKEGETIAQGEVLCEVETDKASMEYESVNEGTLLKILVPEGGQARVGEAIALAGQPGEDISVLLKETSGAARPESAAAPPAPSASAEAAATAAGPLPTAPGPGAGAKASPLARRLSAEHGLDLRSLQGSGPGGRVVKRDVERALRGAAGLAGGAAATAPAPVPGARRPSGAPAAPPPAVAGAGDQRLPLSGKRRIIAQRLSESKLSAPHYYLKIDVDAGPLLASRVRLNAVLPKEERVSFNAFLVKFVAEALKRHPQVNAGWAGDAIVRYGRLDIGLAVAQEDGLITPVVRDCGAKGIVQLDRELSALVEKARTNRLTPEEYTGATFTVTSLGSAGILEFTAIINPPGSAILAVGRVHKAPVVDEQDQVVVRSQMLLTMSCDHRVIDGAVGAAFLADLKRFIENPIEALY